MAETLNEAADDLATAARGYPKQTSTTHWPEQQISLVGPCGRVSGRLVHEVWYCCTAADLQSYWQQRYQWTAQQAQTVDIIGTAAAARGVGIDKARRIQKLQSGWLPVNRRESRVDSDRHLGCSACSASDLTPETVDHLFQCRPTGRRRAILDRFRSFSPKLQELKTAPAIIQALMTGSLAWIEGRQTPHVDTLLLPNTTMGRLIVQAYTEQDELGWNVLFRGFWSHSWRKAQEEQFQTLQGRTRYDTVERWAGKTQLWYYDLFDYIWGLRNADEHGADIDTQRLICLSKCEKAIRRLYDKGEDLPYAERHPFRDPIEDLLQQPVLNQELWITKQEAILAKPLPVPEFDQTLVSRRSQPTSPGYICSWASLFFLCGFFSFLSLFFNFIEVRDNTSWHAGHRKHSLISQPWGREALSLRFFMRTESGAL